MQSSAFGHQQIRWCDPSIQVVSHFAQAKHDKCSKVIHTLCHSVPAEEIICSEQILRPSTFLR